MNRESMKFSDCINGEWYYCHLPDHPDKLQFGRFWGRSRPHAMYLQDCIEGCVEGHVIVVAKVPTRQEWEEVQRLAEFGKVMLAEVKECIVECGFWMYSETVADKAVEYGLMQYVAYDPDKHGALDAEYEPGDMIYYWGKATDDELAS